ncbi:CLUMA_CG008127, isoform A [Clunio marinus]|uniref:CLUMA_CG008127, isoform A n=1 Tax=Clunio marinus TaxID=568069 RepID=A0A1J1I355_9DIPT|nr:CLUMA_CG008127, isoform A [Clunio marinus]
MHHTKMKCILELLWNVHQNKSPNSDILFLKTKKEFLGTLFENNFMFMMYLLNMEVESAKALNGMSDIMQLNITKLKIQKLIEQRI